MQLENETDKLSAIVAAERSIRSILTVQQFVEGDPAAMAQLKNVLTSASFTAQTEQLGTHTRFNGKLLQRIFSAIYTAGLGEKGQNRLSALCNAHLYDYENKKFNKALAEKLYEFLDGFLREYGLHPNDLGAKGDLNLLFEFIIDKNNIGSIVQGILARKQIQSKDQPVSPTITPSAEPTSTAPKPVEPANPFAPKVAAIPEPTVSTLPSKPADVPPTPSAAPPLRAEVVPAAEPRQEVQPKLAEVGINGVLLTETLQQLDVYDMVVSSKAGGQYEMNTDALFSNIGTTVDMSKVPEGARETLIRNTRNRRSLLYLLGLSYLAENARFKEKILPDLSKQTNVPTTEILSALAHLQFLVENKIGKDLVQGNDVAKLEKTIGDLLKHLIGQFTNNSDVVTFADDFKKVFQEGNPNSRGETAKDRDVVHLYKFLRQLDQTPTITQDYRLLELVNHLMPKT